MLNISGFNIDKSKELLVVRTQGMGFFWTLQSDRVGVMQKKYQLRIQRENEIVFDSGLIESPQSIDVSFKTLKLAFATDYKAVLTVEDNYGDFATATLAFTTEPDMEKWQGKWIKPRKHIESNAPYLRKKFTLDKQVKKAVLYASGLGCAEYYINGQKITEDFNDPPATNYELEVFYRAYDVTKFLGEKNAFTAWLGDGWYSQSRVWYWEPSGVKYGDVCLNAQLQIEFIDGSKTVIATDETWKYKYSPILLNNMYAGEVYDCRFETPDFADFDGDEEEWGTCKIDDVAKGKLIPCRMPPERIYRKMEVREIYHAAGDGVWVLDFGENISGIVEINIPRSPRGAQYVLRFAETVNEKNAIDHRSVGTGAIYCLQQDMYIARGDKEGEVWRPRFTIHGFRYVELTGFHKFNEWHLDLQPDKNIATAYAIATDLRETGKFVVEHHYLTRMGEITKNTFLSNYQGFPMDCPVRERCGWLGDAQVMCNYAMMSFDMAASYEKYMSDIRTQTDLYGVCQNITPGRRTCGEAHSLWGAATVLLPYWMYRYYGTLKVVEDSWNYMEKWVEHEKQKSKSWIISEGLGDWLPPSGNNNARRMPVKHSSTMMFYEICDRMAELAVALKLPVERSSYYKNIAGLIKQAIIENFYDSTTHSYGYAGSNGVALSLGLYPEGEYRALADATKALLEMDDYEIHTSIYSNKYLIPELCKAGYGDDALQYLFGTKYISFATMINQGATSVWEVLDTPMINSDLNEGCNSLNHPMHSSFMHFVYSEIAGIKPLAPGFSRFEIAPKAFKDISNLAVSFDSPYGEIRVCYKTDNAGVKNYEITVPVNTVCLFTPIGSTQPMELTSGKYIL